MDPRLIVAIASIIGLVALFVLLWVVNHRTPLPKGCEDIKISEENCGACGNMDCSIKKKFDIKKIEEELKEEQTKEEEKE